MSDRIALPTGAAAASILASSIGVAAMGVLTAAEHVSLTVNKALTFHAPVGPHTGLITVGVIVWFSVWFLLHGLLKNRAVGLPGVSVGAVLLIVLGLLGTCPFFYELLAAVLVKRIS